MYLKNEMQEFADFLAEMIAKYADSLKEEAENSAIEKNQLKNRPPTIMSAAKNGIEEKNTA